ncbi:MAG TPA: LysM peptidoglycan-binding domain-containing protein [Desulfuromonadales bacterium]|nr:LysM peptidoglycan-binding domain-containing protein [Desulfuromonadales bacterium]
MTRLPYLSTTAALFVCLAALPVLGQDYLYVPQAVPSGDAATQSKDGSLRVREVPVEKGDSLYGISKRYSGRGMYYPQILLFNNIKNPDQIFVGDTLKVPMPRSGSSAATKNLQGPPAPTRKQAVSQKKTAPPAPRKQTEETSLTEPVEQTTNTKKSMPEERAPLQAAQPKGRKIAADRQSDAGNLRASAAKPTKNSAASQSAFQNAMNAYRQEDFSTALTLFDRFLAKYPSSPLAADANLYKAECYLKLSDQ